MKRIFLLLLVITAVACRSARTPSRVTGFVADTAMVVSAHPLASEVGAAIMRRGGNAVDASIATQFALAVVYPAAGNIGGGGFMLLRTRDGQVASLDYREKAPAAATTNMYLDSAGQVIAGLSENGHLACGIPGTVAGLYEAHQRYGRMPWAELVQPAIDLALKGFVLTAKEAAGLHELQADLKKYNTVPPTFFLRDNWRAGDSIRIADLGHVLERIRDKGPAGFYEGPTADAIIAEMQRGRGIITYEDLRNYKPSWRKPVTGVYKEYKIISMPPPSSGGIALIQLLKSVEHYPLRTWGHNAPRTVHLMTEAERRAYADRAVHLGDPDFYDVPTEQLIDEGYIRRRMETFDADHATPSRDVQEGKFQKRESEQTTHLSVVDAEGNAVSVTTTLNDSYGSKVIVAGAGFLLNNEMDDFSVKPGVPNMYGAIGGEANKIEAGKRMLSSMTPTILEKHGKLFMVVGTPGGTTIITSVFQTILNVIEHNMTMQEAVNARRFHSQWLPDVIFPEEGAFDTPTEQQLQRMGHTLKSRSSIGRVDAILVLPDGKLEGGADPRGDDAARGF